MALFFNGFFKVNLRGSALDSKFIPEEASSFGKGTFSKLSSTFLFAFMEQSASSWRCTNIRKKKTRQTRCNKTRLSQTDIWIENDSSITSTGSTDVDTRFLFELLGPKVDSSWPLTFVSVLKTLGVIIDLVYKDRLALPKKAEIIKHEMNY